MNNLVEFYGEYSKSPEFRKNYDSNFLFDLKKIAFAIDFDRFGKVKVLVRGGDEYEDNYLRKEAISSGKIPAAFSDTLKKTIGELKIVDKKAHFTGNMDWYSQANLILTLEDHMKNNNILSVAEQKEVERIFDIMLSFYGKPLVKSLQSVRGKSGKIKKSDLDLVVPKSIENIRSKIVTHLDSLDGKPKFNIHEICFLYMGNPILDNPSVVKVLESYRMQELNSINKRTDVRVCSSCEKKTTVLNSKSHGALDKSLLGGSMGGCYPITTNIKQYESYGLVELENSCTCFECGRKITRALEIQCGIGIESVKVKDDNTGKEKDKLQYLERRFRLPLPFHVAREYAIIAYATDKNGKIRVVEELFDIDKIHDPRIQLPFIHLNKKGSTNPAEIEDDLMVNIMIVSSNMARMVIHEHMNVDIARLRKSIADWREATLGSKLSKGEDDKYFIESYYPTINDVLRALGAFGHDGKDFYPSVVNDVMKMVLHGVKQNVNFKSSIINKAISVFHCAGKQQYTIPNEMFSMIRLVHNAGKSKEVQLKPTLDEKNDNPSYLLGRMVAVSESILYFANSKDLNPVRPMVDQIIANPLKGYIQLDRAVSYYVDKGKNSEKAGIVMGLKKKYDDLDPIASSLPKIMMTLDQKAQFLSGLKLQKQANMASKTKERKE